MFKLGKQKLIPGENVTAEAVVVPLEVSRVALPAAETAVPPAQRTERSIEEAAVQNLLAATPLPYLQPADKSVGSMPPRKTDLEPRTLEAISRVLSSAPPLQAGRRTVVILPEDKDAPSAGESKGLYNIIQDFLLPGEYTQAESKLLGFLNLRRSPYTEARVRFYLAQAYYFQGLYEEALLEFILAQDQLYAPVQPWLESCFRNLWETQ